MTMIFLHGSGHQAASWRATVSQMPAGAQILRPNLAALLEGQPARFENLCAAFARYCAKADTPLDLCGLSLGGILALAYTLEHPEKVIRVHYRGALPDTFEKGAEVIVEGRMEGRDFAAKTLMTKCPSKYEKSNREHA